jgi:hypothetical protein
VPPVRLDDLRRRLLDPDKADSLKLNNFPGIQSNHRLAISFHIPVGLVEDAGDGVGRRKPLDDGGLCLPGLAEGFSRESPLWGGPIPAQPSDESYFGMVITSMR